jgi:SAM-dependent methyltransferase
MDWHNRYLQQAAWTAALREYLLKQAGIDHAERVLEVGCGTGAILMELAYPAENTPGRGPRIHGLDIQAPALLGARRHAPEAVLTRGDAHRLPFAGQSFDIACCHFVLLWLSDPSGAIGEMRRVTKLNGHVLALAEPDYTMRVDRPDDLARIGSLQREALTIQGADPSIGSRLAELFDRAGLKILETGTLPPRDPRDYDESEWQSEWAVLREDLAGRLSQAEMDQLEHLDLQARKSATRELHVPTFFVHAQV